MLSVTSKCTFVYFVYYCRHFHVPVSCQLVWHFSITVTPKSKRVYTYRLGMKANTFPFKDGGNASILAAARKESFARGSFRGGGANGPVLRVKASNPVTGLGSVQTQKLPRNLPKLDARNMPSLPQLGQVRRMPPGMTATNNPGIMKPRKLAPLAPLAAADKGKQLLNAGALLQVAESPCAAVDALSITNFICFFFFW